MLDYFAPQVHEPNDFIEENNKVALTLFQADSTSTHNSVITVHLHLWIRRSMMRIFLVCWLYHRTHERAASAATYKFVPLKSVVLGKVYHLSDPAW